MHIVVTGFGPFLNNATNPTKEILGLLPKSIKGHPLTTVELPVVFDECFDVLKPIIDEKKPEIIVMLGLAGGRGGINPERIAINMKNSRHPDNNGNTPTDEIIIKDGPNAYFSTLPLRKIESILTRKHIPVSISNTAGLYVCNNIMYHTLHYIDQNGLNTKAGFIHLPYMQEDVPNDKAFSMPLYDLLEAVLDTIKTML